MGFLRKEATQAAPPENLAGGIVRAYDPKEASTLAKGQGAPKRVSPRWDETLSEPGERYSARWGWNMHPREDGPDDDGPGGDGGSRQSIAA